MRRLPLRLLAIPALLIPALALAAQPLEEGLRLYDALRYEEAVPYLEQAAADAGLPSARRARAALTLGIVQLALGRSDAAREAFGLAVRLEPGIQPPPDSAPKIRRALEEARAAAPAGGAAQAPPPGPAGEPASPLLRHTPPTPGPGRPTVTIELEPMRRRQVADIVVRHRLAGDALWFETRARSTGADTWEAVLPRPGEAAVVEYYFEAFDGEGRLIGRLGSESEPFAVSRGRAAPEAAVTPPESEARGAGWWALAGVGAGALVVGGVIAAVLLTSGGCDAPEGSGCVDVLVP